MQLTSVSVRSMEWDLIVIYCFDIDGTICRTTAGNYRGSIPYENRIAKVNQLFESGNEVVFFTARGSTTGTDWRAFTEHQLASWGVKFHKLILGKPEADLFIDDLAVNSEEFDWGVPQSTQSES